MSDMDFDECFKSIGRRLEKELESRGLEVVEKVDSPEWYDGEVEPIEIIEKVVDGLPADKAYSLGQVLRYCLRAGKKDDIETELGKANNYAHRLVYGRWRGKDMKQGAYIERIEIEDWTMHHCFRQCQTREEAERILVGWGYEHKQPKTWASGGLLAWVHDGQIPEVQEVPNDGYVHVFERMG